MISIFNLESLFLQTLSLRDMYLQWESAGIFDLFLPALLIFAVIFGILTSTNILGANRGINFIISVVIALLAIRVGFVSTFFSTIFPNLGIALAIVLVILILTGLFIGEENRRAWFNILGYGALAVGVIIAIITLDAYDWFGSFWWQENWISVLWIVIMILVFAPLLLPEKQRTDAGLSLKKIRDN